ncbi:galactokinase [Nesterenkonia jeotgali]|uniref:Galactokinase n=1 Tax=Nesterenkonia jeotgali TaxID=317018 RepID=A0A0W8IG06_9MICC|nr:galactokinase [Nesterenkonia jeotgali]KUG58908.1 galactokinase [Nesterenkonia jeotgali]MBA8921220.1 galactokinase [Nesterenkonia jeotgali]
MSAARPALAESFHSAFGRDCAGIWAAPGRVNLIGEHTDYNGGFVLPFALPQVSEVAGAVREDRMVHVRSLLNGETAQFSLDGLAPGVVEGWAAYPAGMLWSLEQAGHRLPGLDLLIDSSVPIGAGLSSSAALECSVALAATDLAGVELPVAELARLAQHAENDFVGMPCGIMDQMASVATQAEHALLLDTRSMGTEQVPFTLAQDDLALLVLDSLAEHRLVDGEYAARRAQCESGARLLGVQSLRELNDDGVAPADLHARLSDEVILRRVRHVLTENVRVLAAREALRTGSYAQLGEILTASHISQRDDFEITVAETDTMVEALLAAPTSESVQPALGARQVGGGFGGCVIALIHTDSYDGLLAAVQENARARGFTEPTGFLAHPSAGARRLA